MTSQPIWSPVDDTTADLLTLVATGVMATDTADREWDVFVRGLHFCAVADDGLIYPNTLRPVVRDHVAPRRIGAFTNRALRSGLVEYTGDWQVSDDTKAGNAGKPSRIMRWVGVTA